MKVMTAMYTIRRGGAYDRFIMMLEAFLERNCETHCISLTPIPINHSYFHNHVMYLPLKTVEGFIAKLAVVCLFPLWSFWIAWRKKIDLIIAFGSLYAFLQGFSNWILKRPMVTFIRGSSYFGLTIQNSPQYFLHLNKIVEYLGLLFSDRIITNNIAARDEILKSLGKRKNIDVQILYNNIPPMNIREPEDISKTRGKYGIPENAKVLVTAGILNRGKNIETLIECLPKIEVNNIYVLIVGDSSTEPDLRYKNSLQGLAKKLGVDKQVFFTGWLEKEDLWKIYLASDLFILPSLNEGMPNAMLEALGLGLPCLGSTIPGVKDILQYEELMFDPLEEESLLQKIQGFFSDRQFFDKVKRLCQERKDIFVFDWEERVFEMITGTPTSLIK
ncbi:MAG: glycosyltransferase family 4 protein [Thermodesulfobacteriota bacterium]|jgi:glycosyltransferase involved in cell wall biosynthesis